MAGKRYARRPVAAKYSGLSDGFLAKAAMKPGGPPFIKVGGAVIYDLDDLDVWLAARKVSSTLEAPAPDLKADEAAVAADREEVAEVRRPRGRPRRPASASPPAGGADRSGDRAA